MKLAAVLVLIEFVAIYAYLAGFDAGASRVPQEDSFRGD